MAHYEYDPYGQITTKFEHYTNLNPFQFSSEFFDIEIGLIYYNYRYYNPKEGRWMSRDLIEEEGGINLYSLCKNNSICNIDYIGLTHIGTILHYFFCPSIYANERLWVMDKYDPYTKIVRDWQPVKNHIARLKRYVAQNAKDWEFNHKTSDNWSPSRGLNPDPHNGWNELEKSPPGTGPNLCKREFIRYVSSGYLFNDTPSAELSTGAIGSFRIIATADNVDICQHKIKLNIWMYNEMSKHSFGEERAKEKIFRLCPMKSQFMWWNWKEEFYYNQSGRTAPILPQNNNGGW